MILIAVLLAGLLFACREVYLGHQNDQVVFESGFEKLKKWDDVEVDESWMDDTLNMAFDWQEEERWERFLTGQTSAA